MVTARHKVRERIDDKCPLGRRDQDPACHEATRGGSSGLTILMNEKQAPSLRADDNGEDFSLIEGKYQARPELPFTPGSVLAGHVVDRGPGVDTPSIGARVACIDMDYGCYTSHAVRPAAAVVSIPAQVSR